MTRRLSISLPDDMAEQLERVAAHSHVSVAATVRAILADTLPRMTSVLEYLGTMTPDEARSAVPELDAWAKALRDLMHDAPEAFAPFRNLLDEGEEL